MPALTMFINGANISHFHLQKDKISIGRDKANDITIDDPSVSSAHALIELDASGHYHIKDCGSTNGIFVNNVPVEDEVKLNDNDLIIIGMTNFTYHDELTNELEQTKKIQKSWIPGVFYLK